MHVRVSIFNLEHPHTVVVGEQVPYSTLSAAQSLVQDLQDGAALECHMRGPR